MSSPTPRRSLALLFLLYFVQGLPFGFQRELGSFFREAGLSNPTISHSRALAMPWMLKFLWAPFVDRFGSKRFGHRKTWIVPTLVLLSLTCLAAAFFPPATGLFGLLSLILLMNLFAATQDIGVDGLAVDILKGSEYGPANIAQVVGYKAGILFSAAILVPLHPHIGWHGILYALAGMIFLWAIALFFWKEPPPSSQVTETRSSLRSVISEMALALRLPGAIWLVLFVGTYKIGEELVDPMLRPFLIDAGYRKEQLALWVGTYGMLASLLGSMFGGFLATRLTLLSAVTLCSVLRAFSMSGEYYLAILGQPGPQMVILVTILEHFCGGALTTAMFAFMMSRVNKAVGGTHYTLLACVEVLGKSPSGIFSGDLQKLIGYSGLFGVGTLLSFLFLLLLIPLRRAHAATKES